ncbi:MAG: RNA polymerase sigma-70 factor [Mangrovibacterium sp.]
MIILILKLCVMLDEKYLLERLKADDESAFKAIYKKYVSWLYYFVYGYIPYHDIVENIIQDTFLVLWEKRSKLEEQTNFKAYLFTIAKNACLYKLRDEHHKQKIFDATDISGPELNANLDALGALDTSIDTFREVDQIIEETLGQLPFQCRTVFCLSRFEAKKNREIAEELGISVKAVEGHISRALKSFRISLKDYLPLVFPIFIL